jgi:hypothetical protein
MAVCHAAKDFLVIDPWHRTYASIVITLQGTLHTDEAWEMAASLLLAKSELLDDRYRQSFEKLVFHDRPNNIGEQKLSLQRQSSVGSP